jgi:lambda family phage portal protein
MRFNILDRTIAFFSPQAGFKRAKMRAGIEAIRAYDGASRGRRTEDWKARGTSANAETKGALHTLRDRAREQDRNNAYAKKAINVIANNSIGAGIRISLKAKEIQKGNVLTHWNHWADYIYCDFDERLNFYGLQKLVMRTVALSGEALVIRHRTSYRLNEVPLELQVLEGDYLDQGRDTTLLDNGGRIEQGIEFDKRGKRKGYWLFTYHPGDVRNTDSGSVFVAAKDVLHIYLKDRPGQERGVPFGTASMVLLKDFKDYQDAELLRQKIASCFALFVQDDEVDTATSGSGPGAEDMSERVEPGIIEHLPPGKTITFANPPTTTGYGEHTKRLLQAIAAGYGITYEALTGDLSMVNFSSGRLGWLEFHRQITDWQQNMIIPQLCHGVFEWFCEAARIAGLLEGGLSAEWTAPRREMIDPVKETNGLKIMVRNGFMSLQEAIRELGYDPDNLLKELKEDMDKLTELGLILDIDGRNDLKQEKPEPKAAA